MKCRPTPLRVHRTRYQFLAGQGLASYAKIAKLATRNAVQEVSGLAGIVGIAALLTLSGCEQDWRVSIVSVANGRLEFCFLQDTRCPGPPAVFVTSQCASDIRRRWTPATMPRQKRMY
jgi:hypothetical protein